MNWSAAGAFGLAGMLSFAGMFLTGVAADKFGNSLVAKIIICSR